MEWFKENEHGTAILFDKIFCRDYIVTTCTWIVSHH